MIHKLFSILLFTVSVLFFTSCTKPDLQFGQQIVGISNTQILMVDTFAPKLSTIYVDSFVTSGKGIGVVGGYQDPIFGKVYAQSFFELNPPPYTANNNSGNAQNPWLQTIYDSLTLIIKYKKGYYYGDTTKPLQINAYRLNQLIVPPNNLTTLFNVDTTSADATPVGSGSVTVFPYRTDTLAIRMSDSLGLELYHKLQNSNDIDMQNNASFLQYFKGLKISTPAGNSLVIGYGDSVIMRLHYRSKGVYLLNQKVDFTIGNTAHHYSNITVDRTGTPLAGINSVNREIPSEQTNNIGYLQACTGTIMKIRFPSLFSIGQLPNFVKLMSAILIIRPVQDTYIPYTLPPKLRLSVTNTAANAIGSDLVGSGSNPAVQYGNLAIDYTGGTNTTYSYDLTNYVKSMMSTNTGQYPGNEVGLLVSPPSGSFELQFNRMVAGNNVFSRLGKLELQIYYAAVQ